MSVFARKVFTLLSLSFSLLTMQRDKHWTTYVTEKHFFIYKCRIELNACLQKQARIKEIKPHIDFAEATSLGILQGQAQDCRIHKAGWWGWAESLYFSEFLYFEKVLSLRLSVIVNCPNMAIVSCWTACVYNMENGGLLIVRGLL